MSRLRLNNTLFWDNSATAGCFGNPSLRRTDEVFPVSGPPLGFTLMVGST